MIKQNLHTHSLYCDGKNTLEEMIQEAIRKQFTILGFSSHAYAPLDDAGMTQEGQEKYKEEVLALKEKYKGQIEIYLGLEQDISYRTKNPETFEYIIGSKHYMEKDGKVYGIDYSKDQMKKMLLDFYQNDFLKFAKAYYEELKEMAKLDEIDIVGHIDLLMKYNEDESFLSFENKQYLQYAYEAIDCLIEANKIFEINTGAMARGYRTTPYPHQAVLKYMHTKGARIVLNSDCHDKDYLDCGYELSLKLIQEAGFTKMEILTQSGFVSKDIKEFI